MPDNALFLTASAMPQLSGPGSSEHSLPQAQGWEVGSLGGQGTSPKTPKSPVEHAFPTVRKLRGRLGRCSEDP